jgi:DNA-binding transcriptional ArsR family regulator
MGSPWKAVADDSRRQMLLLLRDGEKTPSQISENFEFTFPAVSTHLRVLRDGEKTPSQISENFRFTFPAVSTHLRVLRDAGLVVERKEGKNRFYSVNFEKVSEMVTFFDGFWDERLQKLKDHVEKKRRA